MSPEQAIIGALGAMRMGNLTAEFGAVPENSDEVRIQAKVYQQQIEALFREKAATRWRDHNGSPPRVSSKVIEQAANAALRRGGKFPSAGDFAQLVWEAFDAGYKMLSVNVGTAELPIVRGFRVPVGSSSDLQESLRQKALAAPVDPPPELPSRQELMAKKAHQHSPSGTTRGMTKDEIIDQIKREHSHG